MSNGNEGISLSDPDVAGPIDTAGDTNRVLDHIAEHQEQVASDSEAGAPADDRAARLARATQIAARITEAEVGNQDFDLSDVGEEPEPEPEPESEVVVKQDMFDPEQVPEPDPAPEPKPEPEAKLSETDSAVLAAEKKLRSEREARKAAEKKLREAQELFSVDPKAALELLGVESDIFETAEDLYNASLGDEAPDDWKVKSAWRKLEYERESAKRAKEQEEQVAAADAYDQYVDSINSAVRDLDVAKYPVIGKLIDTFGDAEVSGAMLQVAGLAAQRGTVPTPEQLLEDLSKKYQPLVGGSATSNDTSAEKHDDEQKTPTERVPGAKKTKSLRNNMQRSRAPVKSVDDMTPEEYRAYRLKRATQAMREQQKLDEANTY